MKKTIKALLSVMLVCIMVCSICATNVSAANTIISFSKNSVTVGDTVTVTFSFNAGEPIYGIECVINYNSDILQYKSGTASGSAGVLKIVESPSGQSKVSYQLTFTAKKAGSCPVSVADANYSGQTTDKGLPNAGATLTVHDKTLSNNANLKSMYVSSGSLSPRFSPGITTYEVKVKKSVTECKISAVPADAGAKVTVEGSAILQIGKNTRTVVVTAPSGDVKRYTVNITRSETDEEIPAESDPLQVSVDGANMLVATDISLIKLFNGFTASQVDFGDSKVAVAVDDAKEYTLYYLKDLTEGTVAPYTYDAQNQVFEKLKYITQGENTYIFSDIPSDISIPESLYTTNAQIAGMNVKCYASSGANQSDFYYIYCYANGQYGLYRYDSRENVIQRYPDLELTQIAPDYNDEDKETLGFIDRFNSLTRNAKITVIAIAFVIFAILVLIIIFIFRLFTRRRNDDFEDEIEEDGFSDIIIDGYDTPEEKSQD